MSSAVGAKVPGCRSAERLHECSEPAYQGVGGVNVGLGGVGFERRLALSAMHYRLAGLNLLAAIIIYWNTAHLGRAVAERQATGLACPPELLAHTSPLGWAHILLTGEYRWTKP